MTIAIIPAAGLASRLRPISNVTSKAMVPVNGKPAIAYIIDEVKKFADDIRIVHGHTTDTVEYCKRAYPNLNISFYKQEEPKGPLHAIYSALCPVENMLYEDVVVWLGDTIVLDYQTSDEFECRVVYGKVNDWSRWCLIDDNGELHDKPLDDPDTDRALVGIYHFGTTSIFAKRVADIIKSGITVKGEFQMSQLLEQYRTIEQVETKEWYDCGDFPSLYESRARLINRLSRADNHLSVDTVSGTITKSGSRCENEIEWYKLAPNRIRPFIPTVYQYDDDGYVMEYCSGSSLQDILVFENLKEDTVDYTIKKVLEVYNRCFNTLLTRQHKSSIRMWIDKNAKRVAKYDYRFVKDNDLLYVEAVITSDKFRDLVKNNRYVTCIHGDLHFGNILFDYNTGKVKFIDPRGSWGGEVTNGGDLEYDIAKLYQSVYCEYMWIINDVETDYELRDQIVRILDDKFSARYNTDALKLMSAVMMSTCLPFHNEDPKRQKRIWETSLKLIQESYDKYSVCQDREVD